MHAEAHSIIAQISEKEAILFVGIIIDDHIWIGVNVIHGKEMHASFDYSIGASALLVKRSEEQDCVLADMKKKSLEVQPGRTSTHENTQERLC